MEVNTSGIVGCGSTFARVIANIIIMHC